MRRHGAGVRPSAGPGPAAALGVGITFGAAVVLVLGGCSGAATATSAGATTSASTSSAATATAGASSFVDVVPVVGASGGATAGGSTPAGTGATTAAVPVGATPRSSASVTVIPCERLTSAQVAVWLGSSVTTTVPADLAAVGEQGDGPAIQKLDGCLYQSATGSLGYDVLSLAGWSTATQVDLVKHQIPETSGTQAFDPGIGSHSFGFTSPMGASVFAVVHVLADDRLTTVSLTLPGATAAVARQRAVAVATAMRG